MTRINCIPPEELTDKHLVAEYRELPRVLTLATKYVKDPPAGITWNKFYPEYRLGKGHVRFFYNRLKWLHKRYDSLITEMQMRGFTPRAEVYGAVLKGFDRIKKNYPDYYNDWEPTKEAQRLNRQRIKERLTK